MCGSGERLLLNIEAGWGSCGAGKVSAGGGISKLYQDQCLCLPLKSLQGHSIAQMTITGTSDTMLSLLLFVKWSSDDTKHLVETQGVLNTTHTKEQLPPKLTAVQSSILSTWAKINDLWEVTWRIITAVCLFSTVIDHRRAWVLWPVRTQHSDVRKGQPWLHNSLCPLSFRVGVHLLQTTLLKNLRKSRLNLWMLLGLTWNAVCRATSPWLVACSY